MWHRRGNIRWTCPVGEKIHRCVRNPLRNGLLDSQLLGLLLTGVDDETDPPLLKNPVVSSHMFVLFSYVIYYSSIPAMSSATSQCSTVIVNDNVESIHSEAERAILTLIRCNSTKGIPQIHRFVPSSSHKDVISIDRLTTDIFRSNWSHLKRWYLTLAGGLLVVNAIVRLSLHS